MTLERPDGGRAARESQAFAARQRAEFLEGAQTLGWEAIWLRMATARFALLDAVQDVTQAQADWSPAPVAAADESTWSIADIMRHLITASPNIAEIIAATANGRTAPKGPPGQITAPPAAIDSLQQQLTQVSERLLSVRNAFPEPAQINHTTTVPHAFFGELPAYAWPLFQAFHDTDHRTQIQTLKRHPNFPNPSPRT